MSDMTGGSEPSLNHIILNKRPNENNNRKIVLAVATLGVLLIIVVMLMNSLTIPKVKNGSNIAKKNTKLDILICRIMLMVITFLKIKGVLLLMKAHCVVILL